MTGRRKINGRYYAYDLRRPDHILGPLIALQPEPPIKPSRVAPEPKKHRTFEFSDSAPDQASEVQMNQYVEKPTKGRGRVCLSKSS
jgi:hypothetical protein